MGILVGPVEGTTTGRHGDRGHRRAPSGPQAERSDGAIRALERSARPVRDAGTDTTVESGFGRGSAPWGHRPRPRPGLHRGFGPALRGPRRAACDRRPADPPVPRRDLLGARRLPRRDPLLHARDSSSPESCSRHPVGGGGGLRTFWSRRARRLMPAAFHARRRRPVRRHRRGAPAGERVAGRRAVGGHLDRQLALHRQRTVVPRPRSRPPRPRSTSGRSPSRSRRTCSCPIGLLFLARRRCPPLVIAALLGGAALAVHGVDVRAPARWHRARPPLLRHRHADRRAADRWSARRRCSPTRVATSPRPPALRGDGLRGARRAPLVGRDGVAARRRAYRGGFLAFSLLTCAAILAILADIGPVRSVLSTWPLPQIGRISYGLYLYHWPIYLWLTADRPVSPAGRSSRSASASRSRWRSSPTATSSSRSSTARSRGCHGGPAGHSPRSRPSSSSRPARCSSTGRRRTRSPPSASTRPPPRPRTGTTACSTCSSSLRPTTTPS